MISEHVGYTWHLALSCRGFVEEIGMTTCTEELLQGIIFTTDGIIPASEATKGNRNWILRSRKETA